MTVFIGGSRALTKLNAIIRARLDDLIQRQCSILIGDAAGADKAVQQYLAEREYADVTVYCMQSCRNNLGSWSVRHIDPPRKRSAFRYYAEKDLVMSREAKCGVMFWDGKSKGTLNNVLNLIGAGKKTLVHFAPSNEFHVVASEADLRALLAHCQKRDLDIARSLGLTDLDSPLHLPLAQI